MHAGEDMDGWGFAFNNDTAPRAPTGMCLNEGRESCLCWIDKVDRFISMCKIPVSNVSQ